VNDAVALGFVVGGCAMVVAAVVATLLDLEIRRNSIRTTGQVIGRERGGTLLRWVDFKSLEIRYYPVVEFTTRHGETVRATSSVGRRRDSLFPSHRIGSRIRIAYDPDNPRTVRWRPFFGSTWIASLSCLVVGVVCVATGISFLISRVT
jgi:hypothetical protein